jgi:hypothetical protein
MGRFGDGAGLIGRPERISVQALAEALMPGNGASTSSRALARLSRKSRPISISGRDSGLLGIVISCYGAPIGANEI